MRYCIDIDGTICSGVEGRDYHKAKPMTKRIEIINKLYDEGDHITYFTARAMGRFSDLSHEVAQAKADLALRELTEKQLEQWGCKYHRLLMGKPHADIFIDDKGRDSDEYFYEHVPHPIFRMEDNDDFVSRRSSN